VRLAGLSRVGGAGPVLPIGRDRCSFFMGRAGLPGWGSAAGGYQYLHGTDATVGDFQMAGTTQVNKLAGGAFVAKVEAGPEQSGVATWVAVIGEAKTGREVFRDSYGYSARHGVGVTWLSSADQLWLISADVGLARVGQGTDGRWTKTTITPETLAQVPPEIARLRR
jgi:hypothetical protein